MDVTRLPGMHYIKFKKDHLIEILLILSIIPLVSGIQVNSGTIIQSTEVNLTINITQSSYVDFIQVGDSFIYLENFSVSGSTNKTLNLTQTNTIYSETDLLSIGSSSSASSSNSGSSSGGGGSPIAQNYNSSNNQTNSTSNVPQDSKFSSPLQKDDLSEIINTKKISELEYLTIGGIIIIIISILALFISLGKNLNKDINSKIADKIKKEHKKSKKSPSFKFQNISIF